MVNPNDFNLLRKYSRFCAFLTIVSIFSYHLRLLEIVEPRNLKCWTISTVLSSIKRGEREKISFSYNPQSFLLFLQIIFAAPTDNLFTCNKTVVPSATFSRTSRIHRHIDCGAPTFCIFSNRLEEIIILTAEL